MRQLFVIIVFLGSSSANGQISRIEWASFPVERQAYDIVDKSNRYSQVGHFDGIGMLYFSPAKNTIEFKGFRELVVLFLPAIHLPFLERL